MTVVGQTVAVIDTRGHSANAPFGDTNHCGWAGSVGGGSFDGGDKLPRLRATLTVRNPEILILNQAFEYELLVTNDTREGIVIPQSLDPDDVEEAGEKLQDFMQAYISFEVEVERNSRSFTGPDFVSLYGKTSKPYTFVKLERGESVRILGTTIFNPSGLAKPASGDLNARLHASLIRGNTGVRRTARPGCGGYESYFDGLANIRSDNAVDVSVKWH